MEALLIYTSDPGLLVKILIGKDSNINEFLMHKEFACHASPVFDSDFNGSFVEGQTLTYTMEDTTKQTFKYLVQ